MTYIIIAVILIIKIVIYVRAENKKKEAKNITQKQTEQNHYEEMREMAFLASTEQLGLSSIGKDQVYGIISEMDMEGATITLATFLNGDASIYFSSGGGVIGAGQHESVEKIVKEYVKNGQNYLDKGVKTEKTNLPENGMGNFNFLTEKGIYKISQSLNNLESGNSEFSNLFVELNEIINEIRIKIVANAKAEYLKITL